jgi:hypothetical protein
VQQAQDVRYEDRPVVSVLVPFYRGGA